MRIDSVIDAGINMKLFLILIISVFIANVYPRDTITVLVAYTPSADSEHVHLADTVNKYHPSAGFSYSINNLSLSIDSAMRDLQETVNNSNLQDTVYFSMVCKYLTRDREWAPANYFLPGDTSQLALRDAANSELRYRAGDDLRFTGGEYYRFDEVQTYRDIFDADLCMLVTLGGYGVAPDNVFGVIGQGEMIQQRGFTHEIGHIIGPGDFGHGLSGAHPDAGITRPSGAIWHTQTNNLNSGGNCGAGYYGWWLCNDMIPFWSTTDTSVRWRGIQLASTAVNPNQYSAVNTIRQNVHSRSLQRTTPDTKTISNITFDSATTGIIRANTSITIGPTTTFSEGTSLLLGITGAVSLPKISSRDKSKSSKLNDTTDIDLRAVPNPFNPSTVFKIKFPNTNGYGINFNLAIYDVNGRSIKEWHGNSMKHNGFIEWNGRTENNRYVSAGMYFARLTTTIGIKEIKIFLVK